MFYCTEHNYQGTMPCPYHQDGAGLDLNGVSPEPDKPMRYQCDKHQYIGHDAPCPQCQAESYNESPEPDKPKQLYGWVTNAISQIVDCLVDDHGAMDCNSRSFTKAELTARLIGYFRMYQPDIPNDISPTVEISGPELDSRIPYQEQEYQLKIELLRQEVRAMTALAELRIRQLNSQP